MNVPPHSYPTSGFAVLELYGYNTKIWTGEINYLVCVNREVLTFSSGLTYAAILRPVVDENDICCFCFKEAEDQKI